MGESPREVDKKPPDNNNQITQNIKDLLASREIENIFENSDFIYMLNQASGDRQILAKQLKKIGMLIVQDQVWNRVTINRSAHKSTRYYVDEFHLLLKEEQTAAYSVEIWKRFRKWGGIPTGELVCYLLVA